MRAGLKWLGTVFSVRNSENGSHMTEQCFYQLGTNVSGALIMHLINNNLFKLIWNSAACTV